MSVREDCVISHVYLSSGSPFEENNFRALCCVNLLWVEGLNYTWVKLEYLCLWIRLKGNINVLPPPFKWRTPHNFQMNLRSCRCSLLFGDSSSRLDWPANKLLLPVPCSRHNSELAVRFIGYQFRILDTRSRIPSQIPFYLFIGSRLGAQLPLWNVRPSVRTGVGGLKIHAFVIYVWHPQWENCIFGSFRRFSDFQLFGPPKHRFGRALWANGSHPRL